MSKELTNEEVDALVKRCVYCGDWGHTAPNCTKTAQIEINYEV